MKLVVRAASPAVVSDPTPAPDPAHPDPGLRIRHHLTRNPAALASPCVWCGRPTTTLAETPFAPELGFLPLMVTCGAHMRIVYRMLQKGQPLDAWETERVAAIRGLLAESAS